MKITYKNLGKLGVLPINLPVIELGSGSPKGLILALQHGAEVAPLWVIKKIIEQKESLKGSISIIPVANPMGFVYGTRNESVENKNLNRSFPGSQQGDFTSKLANNIFEICQKQDFVIDLHTFSNRQSPFIAGYSASQDPVQKKTNKLLNGLNPEIVWKTDEGSKNDSKFKGSLNGQLNKINIPSVFIEMPNYQLIKNKAVDDVTNGIINIFKSYPDLVSDKIICQQYSAKFIYSNFAGLFEAKVKVMDQIKTGQPIGIIYQLPDFKPIEITAPANGIIMTILEKGVVRTGSKIASLGV